MDGEIHNELLRQVAEAEEGKATSYQYTQHLHRDRNGEKREREDAGKATTSR